MSVISLTYSDINLPFALTMLFEAVYYPSDHEYISKFVKCPVPSCNSYFFKNDEVFCLVTIHLVIKIDDFYISSALLVLILKNIILPN